MFEETSDCEDEVAAADSSENYEPEDLPKALEPQMKTLPIMPLEDDNSDVHGLADDDDDNEFLCPTVIISKPSSSKTPSVSFFATQTSKTLANVFMRRTSISTEFNS